MRDPAPAEHTRSRMEAGPRRRSIFASPRSMARGPPATRNRIMKWETPTAVDQRFGFEITMYISTR